MNKRWLLSKTNAEFVTYLSRSMGIFPITAQVLINRGIKTPDEVTSFISREPKRSDPFTLGGIEEAVKLIRLAVRNKTRIFIHGDYDTDGLTATSIMLDALRRIGADVDYFIPNRFEHGYGFKPHAVDIALKLRAGMILTVDCGITAFDAVELARSKGLTVIVTDHHEPETDNVGSVKMPVAHAIVNPKLDNPELSNLSGAGVALKLVDALSSEYPDLLQAEAYVDLAALGTIADSVPLIAENRSIVIRGMDAINEGRRPGIKALKEISGLNAQSGRRSRSDISFTIVPRINAAGRLGDASDVVRLLLTESEDEAMLIASQLDKLNVSRQKIEELLHKEALRQIDGGIGNAIVIYGNDWHEGVIGILASKFAEKFYRPTFVITVNGERGKGSGRSIPEFDIFEGISACRELLISPGGHRQAVGFSIHPRNIEPFKEKIDAIVKEKVESFTPSISIDAGVNLGDITLPLISEFDQLAPFGYGNPVPVLGARDVQMVSPRIVGNNHLKLRLKSKSHSVDAIGFYMGSALGALEDSATVDAAFTVSVNEWEGRRMPQVQLRAIRPSAS